jgi:hypothetical protein
MDLYQLADFMHEKRKEFEGAVNHEAKKISFAEITKEIHLDTFRFVDRDWGDGQRLEFLLCQGHYTAVVDRDTLILRGSHDIEVARFTGNEVKRYYESLSTAILKAKQEDLDNLPF